MVGMLSGWEVSAGALEREFEFDSYMRGIEFVQRIAEAAERLNHHPDIFITLGAVRVTLSACEAQSVTDDDRDMAAKISVIYSAVMAAASRPVAEF